MSEKQGILTIAIGKKFAAQAKYLSLSCILNSPSTLRAVITDLPVLLADYYDIIIPYTNKDDPFSIKTRLYEFTSFEKTIYLDADSLVINPVDPFFDYLENNHYLYEGTKISNGKWYYDIKEVCKKINVSWIPKINSGMFIFDNSQEAKQIFNTAYHYFMNHKKEGIDIPFFRGTNYPDEPVMAISLALHNVEPVNDFGRFSRTLIKATNIHINVTKRIARFVKNGKIVYPQVVHFCGRFGNLIYITQKIKLLFYFSNPVSRLLCNMLQLFRKRPGNNYG